MRVAILALGDVFDLGLAAVMDAFATANELNAMTGLGAPTFDVQLTGVRRRVRTSQGFSAPVGRLSGMTPEVVVVPAIGFKMPDPLEAALDRPEVRDAAILLRQWAESGAVMTAACIGTFVLAESGLLDKRRATTTWWLAPLFRRRYPAVVLDESNMVVRSGRFITAGAALGHMDLALSIIRGASPQLAALTARYLIVDSRSSQSAYALTDHLAHTDPLVERFEQWARGRLRQGFSLDDAARTLGASKRTLARHLQQVLGTTPLAYFQRIRVERAVYLLKTSNVSVDTIATRVGYSDGVTLRTLLRRQLGIGIKEIRRG
ncbi:MAG: helix-turn-helix domain-containing protein [Vicinamibacteria bacterium]